MSPIAVALVLAAAASHAAWNLLAKRAESGAAFVWLCAVVASALWAPVALTAILLSPPELGPVSLLLIAVSSLLHTAYYLALQGSYRRGDLSVVYPAARGTGALLAVVAAVVALGERPTPIALAGAVLIAVGIFALAGSQGMPGALRIATLIPAIGTGVIISLYTVWDALLVTDLAVPALALVWVADVGRSLLLAPIASRWSSEVARTWRRYRTEVIGVAVLSPIAYVLVLFALHFAPISQVAPTREVSILIGVMVGRHLLGEPDTVRRLAAAGVVILGTILATLG